MSKNGIWVPVNEKPSDTAINGTPRPGEIVEITYDSTPVNPNGATRIASKAEDSSVYKSKQSGMSIFFSAK